MCWSQLVGHQGNVTNMPICKESGSLGPTSCLVGKLASWKRFHDNLMCNWSGLAKKEPLAVCLLLVWTLGQKHPPPPLSFSTTFFFIIFKL